MKKSATKQKVWPEEEEYPGRYSGGHFAALRLAAKIAACERRMCRWSWGKTTMIYPQRLMQQFREARISFLLLGIYAFDGWRDQPRSTHDIDLLVRPWCYDKAVKVVHDSFPKLKVEESSGLTRFLDPVDGNNIVDIYRPEKKVIRDLFANTIDVEHRYRIPTLEMALAMKFRSMTGRNREMSKKYQDASDFMNMAGNNFHSISLEKLLRLGDAFDLGGERIVDLVKEIHFSNNNKIDRITRFF